MKVGCVVLAVVLLANGCANREKAVTNATGVAIVGAGAASVGLLMLFASLFPPDDPSKDDSHALHVGGGILTAGGGVMGIAGLITIIVLRSRLSREEEWHAQQRIHDWDEASKLSNECAEAARAGHCEMATRLALRVKSLDAHVYATVFMGDPAIAQCFEPLPADALEVP
jgi:hypothetical protein